MTHGTAKLTLTIKINGQDAIDYQLVKLDGDEMIAAWRLRKPDGTEYDAHADKFGLHCTCPDGVYKRENQAVKCKHCRSLEAVGLLPKEP